MPDRENELFAYFTNNINIQENLIEIMKRLNVFHLLYDKLEHIDKKETIYQKIRRIRQKKFNSLVQHEMINIHKMALKYNIQVVFLKGLTFAEELYEPREIGRWFFNDKETSYKYLKSN
ncbi:MAG: hypothetical protein ACFWUE_07185 [Xylanivirga thermophila]|jgi:hypothetical protein|uniref:hypothetical protein n=1 Tax=Xylanivirga thermophila TaxID=2496273 RepID=UPI0039F5E1AF